MSVASLLARCHVLALCLVSMLSLDRAFAAPEYSLLFGSPPAHWDQALDDNRLKIQAGLAFDYIACGAETSFVDHFRGFTRDPKNSGEDVALDVLGKLAWLKSPDRTTCTYYGKGNLLATNDDEKELFPTKCEDVISEKGVVLSRACIEHQVNHVLTTMSQGILQLGSGDLPCYWSDPTHLFDGGHFTQVAGDWDATLRVLLRIAYLAKERGLGAFQLDPAASKNLNEQLLSAQGSPAQESYSAFQCGNQERSTGSAADRVADTDWTDDVLDALGDLFSWFLKRLLLIVVAAVALSVLVLVPGAGPVLAFVGGGGAGAVT